MNLGTSGAITSARARHNWIAVLLCACALLLLGARPAHAQTSTNCVGTYGGLLDGNITPVPANLQIDGACVIKNYPASNPYGGNISLLSTRGTLLIFDNVDFTGNISCDLVHGNVVWFVNGSITRQHVLNCTNNVFVDVEKINKQNPPGPPFVAIGVPFTYTFTFPQVYDPLTSRVTDPNGSPNDISQITVTDNLNATGVSLSYVSSTAAWKSSGAPVPFTVSNNGGLLTFSGFPTIPAHQQIVLTVTVVLNNAVPPNSPGTSFVNTANWQFGRVVNGVYTYPLPGQQGVTPPLTIVAPKLIMTKGGPATMNVDQPGQFTLNLQNTGTSDVWNATIKDRLPSGATGGMCAAPPKILSAQVFQADGVTAVPGKTPLVAGTDFTLTYASAPTCALTLNMLTAAAVIGPTQRLIITYQAQLDPGTQNGVALTNVAGATQWYDAPSGNPARQTFTCPLTDGTPGVADCQDAHTVTATAPAAAIVMTKGGPATMTLGQPGKFTLNLQNTGISDAWNVAIQDRLPNGATGGMCAAPPTILSAQVFAADGVTPVPGKGPLVAGTDYTVSWAGTPTCTLALNMLTPVAVIGPTQRLIITYQAQLDPNTAYGATLTNVAGATQWYDGPSSNPGRQTYTCTLTNGTPGVADCQDAHTVTVPASATALVMTKGGPVTVNVNQPGQFTLNLQNTGTSDGWNVTIQDRLPTGATGGMCAAPPKVLAARVFAADGVTPVAGKGPLVGGADYTVSWAGAPTCTLTLSMLTAAAVMGPTQRLIITYQAQLDPGTQNGATLTNVAGATQWYDGPGSSSSRKTFTCPLTDGTPGVADCQDAHTVTAGSSALTIIKQVTVVGGGAAVPGAVLEYLLHVTNATAQPANPVVITDDLNAAGPGALTYVTGTATMNGSPTGVTVTGNVITANYSQTYGPLAPRGTIDLRFRATLGATLPFGTTVTNTGGVTWDNPPQSASGSVSIVVDTPPGALTVSKTTPLVNVTRGQLVPYTIVVTNVIGGPVQGAALVDRFPAGFRYVKGSARLDGVPAEPAVVGLTLTWTNLSFAAGGHHSIVLILAVGAGVGEGEFANRAQALDAANGPAISKEATATVRVVPDQTFDCTDVLGKVFDDANGNGRQDPGEKGLPGVRVVTTRGLAAITDEYGRFHITCAITPLEGRGSNFVLKLDERTLPSGYRSTTPDVLVERATRGKALRFEFGASIHHVVSLDLSDAAFEPGSGDLRPQWQGRIDLLLEELHKSRSVLHLAYLADVEDPRLVERRIDAVAGSIRAAWQAAKCCYELSIEREIFWLRGSPPREPVERLRDAR
jgi:uncharacterized repeat protein (TIGR01451 family)